MRGRRSAHLSLMALPFTVTWSSGVIFSPSTATWPFTCTQPLLIHSSISRREPTPLAASTFCKRSGSMRDKSVRFSFNSCTCCWIFWFGARTTSLRALAARCFTGAAYSLGDCSCRAAPRCPRWERCSCACSASPRLAKCRLLLAVLDKDLADLAGRFLLIPSRNSRLDWGCFLLIVKIS